MATVHDVDYLLTWNYAHLANPVVQERLGKVAKNPRFEGVGDVWEGMKSGAIQWE